MLGFHFDVAARSASNECHYHDDINYVKILGRNIIYDELRDNYWLLTVFEASILKH